MTSVGSNSPDIKNRYFLDNGQRDGYYDHGKIIKKKGEPTPNHELLILFDYFVAGTGDFYDVQSYNAIIKICRYLQIKSITVVLGRRF